MPPPWYANPAIWSFALASASFGLLAVLLSLRWRGEARSAFLLAAVLLSAFWAGCSVSFALSPRVAMWTTATIFDVARIGAFVTFVFLLFGAPGDASPALRRGRVYALLTSLALATAAVLGVPSPGAGTMVGGEPALVFALLLSVSIVGLAAAEQIYRRTPAAMRWQVRPVAVGLGSLFAYDLVLYADATLFRALDPTLWAARGVAHAFVVPVIGVAAARNREWSFDVSLSRGVLIGSSTVLGAAAYLLGIAVLGYYVRFVGGDWGATLAVALTFGAGLLLALVLFSGTFRSKLRVLVAKNFFAYRYDYREEWLNFTRLIVAAGGGRSLHAQCIEALGNLVETSTGALWLRRDSRFVQIEHNGLPVADTALEETDVLPSFLRATGWVIDVQEALRQPENYRGLQLPAALARSDAAWLIVPLPFGEQLIGFVVLGRPRVDFKLDWEVHDLLKTAGRQAASYIAQAQATEHLLEARKFDAFNRMSAFVVHDLKNLIAQLQLMLRNAERHAANPDFQRDMLKTVEHVVSRMSNLTLQLRAGEQPVDRAHVVDLCAIAAKVASVRAAGRTGLDLDAGAPVFALGHEDRLERVIGHLVQNAFDAIDGAPRVALRVYAEGDIAVVEVDDNGAGMSSEFIRERLFKPFNSTKQAGMGIGTYESQQYVNSVGGRIAVSSEPGVGTTFRVYLRRAEAPVQVDHVIA